MFQRAIANRFWQPIKWFNDSSDAEGDKFWQKDCNKLQQTTGGVLICSKRELSQKEQMGR
jgi:hypothetical protein